MPAGCGGCVPVDATEPVVDHVETQRGVVVPRMHHHPGRAGVAQAVGEGLLHEAVGRQVDGGRHGPRHTGHVELDVEAGRAYPFYQVGELRDPGLRRERRVVPGLQHAEQPAHLRQCLLAHRADGVERRGGCRRVAFQRHRTSLGLHDHHADVMCDDVVQLAGDAVALGDDRRLGFGGAGEFELFGPGLERAPGRDGSVRCRRAATRSRKPRR